MFAASPAQILLDQSLRDISSLERFIRGSKAEVLLTADAVPIAIPSNMDALDAAAAVIVGIVGGVFSTHEEIRRWLARFHDRTGNDNILQSLLRHSGDEIDRHTTRLGGNAKPPYHRVLWGHDPFSWPKKGDNPFVVLVKQHGFLRGIVQVFRHLLADTFSKQGLPIPFHSYLDVRRLGKHGEEKLSNWLIEIAEQANRSVGAKVPHPQVFSRLFAIHMQEILSAGLTWALCVAYLRARDLQDEIRGSQFRALAFATNFLTHAIIGMVRTGGVPYIHWPTISLITWELWRLFRLTSAEIRELQQRTAELVQRNLTLQARVMATGVLLPSYETSVEYVRELDRGVDRFREIKALFDG